MRIILFIISLCISNSLLADTIRVDLKTINDEGLQEKLGHVDLIETPRGIVFSFDTKLAAGEHGYNIHDKSGCKVIEPVVYDENQEDNTNVDAESTDNSADNFENTDENSNTNINSNLNSSSFAPSVSTSAISDQASTNEEEVPSGICYDAFPYASNIYTIMLNKDKNKGVFPSIIVGSNKHNKQSLVIDSIKNLKPLLNKVIVIRVGDIDASLNEITKLGANSALAWGVISETGIIPSSPEDNLALSPIKEKYLKDLDKSNADFLNKKALITAQKEEAKKKAKEEALAKESKTEDTGENLEKTQKDIKSKKTESKDIKVNMQDKVIKETTNSTKNN